MIKFSTSQNEATLFTRSISAIYVLLVVLFCLWACETRKQNQIIPTQITTGTVSDITHNAAKCEGTIDPGSETVSEAGHCWSLTNNQPTVSDTKASIVPSKTKQSFTSTLTALESEKTYYIRAYALIAGKAYYGDLATFTTAKPPIPPPGIVTNPATEVQYNSAKVSFTIQFAAGSNASQHGVCWATTNNPSVNDNKTTLGNASGTVNSSSVLGGLSEKTTYYARAYATVGTETYYGNVVSFSTSGVAPIVNTGAVSDITANTAKVAFSLQLAAGTSATQHGVCWATNANPSINDSRTSLGATNSNVNGSSNLTSLTTKTTYYARAYATVNATTYYGNVVSFSTSDLTPVVNTGAVSDITANTAKVAFSLQLAAGTSATQHGVCWATNANPSINDSRTSLGATNSNVNSSSNLTSLTTKTTYYARAYATVNATTYYGNVVIFSTQTDTPQTSDGSAGFLFYNSSNGQAVFGEILNNSYRDVKILGSLGTGWRHVVSYKGMVLLMDNGSRLGTAALFDGKQIIRSFSGLQYLGWSHLTVIDDRWLLFYNTSTGGYVFGDIQNNEYRILLSGTNFSTGWTSILSFGTDLFFYNADTGTGVWGGFNGNTFTQYTGNERLDTNLNASTYGDGGSFWWNRNTGEVGNVYNYAARAAGASKPSLTQIQKINLKLYKRGIVTAGNTKNLAQMLDTSLDIYAVEGGNKLSYQRTSGINTWTHLITVKFN